MKHKKWYKRFVYKYIYIYIYMTSYNWWNIKWNTKSDTKDLYICVYIYIYKLELNSYHNQWLNGLNTKARPIFLHLIKKHIQEITMSCCLISFFVFQTLSNDVIKYLMHPRIGTFNMASHTLQIKPPQNRKVIWNIWLPSIHHNPPNKFLEFLSWLKIWVHYIQQENSVWYKIQHGSC